MRQFGVVFREQACYNYPVRILPLQNKTQKELFFMSVLTAVVLGLVQGIAEFLPISSSGHLAIAEHLLSIQGASNVPDFFDVLLHLGTLMAVFAAYWDDIRDMIVEFFTGIGDLAHQAAAAALDPQHRRHR